MQFPCPACGSPISANPPKPGKYNPKCPKCGTPFVLQVQINPPKSAAVRAPAPRKPLLSPDADGTLASVPEQSFAGADADGTLPSVAEPPRPSVKKPPPPVESEATFASSPTSPDADFDPDATEASGGAIPRDNGDVDRTSAVGSDAPADEATAQFDTAAEGRMKAGVKPKAKPRPATPDEDMPDALGGYEILKQLGKGGMGAVYLARQMSLDRAVALKVMNAECTRDPVFLARFVREAYAAAQLTHHNVVQIYDIGADAGTSFFSMEFVDGKSLGDLLRKDGKVTPAEAVGYAIQAASGLRFAHDRGMVHRDIKPDNLMVNNEGIVKVADLGLVKTRGMSKDDDAAPEEDVGGSRPGSVLKDMIDVTNVGTAMGTPSYMAPEQCRDASAVDGRADVYSLGCTLYALLAGRAPFQGKTAVELISKHLSEPPPPLARVAAEVPKDLAAIVDRTLEKDPDARFQSMDEFIAALKEWQTDQDCGPPKPTEEQLTQFEGLVKKLHNTGGGARKIATLGPVVGVLAGVGAMFVSPVVGGAVLIGTAAAVVSGVVASGLLTGSYLFKKGREWALGAGIGEWLTVGLGAILFFVALFFAGLLGAGLGGIAGGTVLGLAYAFLVAKPGRDRQLDIKDDLEAVLKRVRLNGVDEDGIRAFVIDTAGDKWEQTYETLYGYPAKAQARAEYAAQVSNRPKFGGWRDGPILRFEAALDARKKARDKKLLLAVEVASLKAEGMDAAEAKAKAADNAEDLVEQAVEIRAANTDKKKKVDVRAVLTRYDRAKMAQRPPRPRANPLAVLFRKIAGIPFDPRLRLVVGAALVIAGLMWVRQNTPANASPSVESLLSLAETPEKSKPLTVSFLPADVTSWVNSLNVFAAGLLAVLSLFVGRTITLLGMALGAAVAVVGYQVGLPIPDAGPLKPVHLCGIAGFVLGLLSLFLLGVHKR